MFLGIPYTDIDSVWMEILPWIEIACRKSKYRYLPEDIYKFLLDREMQLWVWKKQTIEACCVTEITNYPRKKYAQIRIGCGRNRKDWQQCVLTLEEWAKSEKCDGIESIAREGWWKAFYRFLKGWEKTHIFIEKEF